MSDQAPEVDCNGKWSRYFNLDHPSEGGDFELLETLRRDFPDALCRYPSGVDARLVGTNLHHPIFGVVASANHYEGFVCKNQDQLEGACLDFEIRFCCPEGKVFAYSHENVK